MANLNEQTRWEEGIYQIEESDPVVGGPDGISNKQAKQLANRTQYLKAEVGRRYIEQSASTEQAGTVQLVDNVTTDDGSKALTARQGLSLKRLIDGLTRNLGNYIPNSKKSNSVTSPSSDTVATSNAAKTAYDRGTEGINAANEVGSRVTTLENETWKFDQKIIPNGTDLNTIRQPGFYRKTSNSYTMRNEPTSLTFDMQVMSIQGDNEVYVKQLVFVYNSNVIYSRFIDNSRISDWERVDSLRMQVGIPIPYPLSTVPSGYLPMRGQYISRSSYPKLYEMYNGRLPDLRGEFIRGWDNGRGVDSGRALLSEQGDAIRNITGNIDTFMDIYTQGAFVSGNYSGGVIHIDNTKSGYHSAYFDASRVVPTANENRPRNIAFQYICLAD